MQRRPQASAPTTWPPAAAGVFAALWAAVVSSVSFVLVFSAGWVFTADARSTWGGVARTSLGLWMLAHSVPVSGSGITLGLTPLLVTLLALITVERGARWAVRNSLVHSLLDALLLLFSLAGTYGIVGASVAAVLSPQPSINSSRAFLGFFAWSLLAALIGLRGMRDFTPEVPPPAYVEPGDRTVTKAAPRSPYLLLSGLGNTVPAEVRSAVWVAVRCSALLLLSGGIALFFVLMANGASAWDMISLLSVGPAQQLELAAFTLAYLPTLALWCFALVLGPGFSVSAGTLITLQSQTIGPLPQLPLFALLPNGLGPAWKALYLLPLLAMWFGSAPVRRQLRGKPAQVLLRAWALQSSALAVLVMILASVSTGPFGAGRYLTMGPQPLSVGLTAAGWLLLVLVADGSFATWQAGRPVRTKAAETDGSEAPEASEPEPPAPVAE